MKIGETVSFEKGKNFLTICGILGVVLVMLYVSSFVDRARSEPVNKEVVAPEPKRIALTFDDGPCDVDGGTNYLLDGLKERGVKVTFFVLGKSVDANPELTKRIYQEGHLLGNHTYNHIDVAKGDYEKVKQEILETNEAVESCTGYNMEYMRPPFGSWKKSLETELKMFPVMWSVDSRDWTVQNTPQIVDKVVSKADEDAIILMHDGYKTSADAAFIIIDTLKKQGYEFVTVDEILLD